MGRELAVGGGGRTGRERMVRRDDGDELDPLAGASLECPGIRNLIVIGASSTIGQAVVEALRADGHEVLGASRSGPLSVDLEDAASIRAMFETAGTVDAVISTAGRAAFGTVQDASPDAFDLSLRSKLMGQVNLIRLAAAHLSPSASIVVTTGVLGSDPGPGTAPVAMANAGLEGFVRAAARDLPKGPRVVAVSPGFVRW